MQAKRALSAEVKDESRGEFVALFSRFGGPPDKDGDITLRGAFTDGQVVPVSAYGHRSWHGELPVGMATIRTTATEALAEGRFFLDTTGGADTFRVVRELGAFGQWSYGFDIAASSKTQWEGKTVRVLEKLITHEVSPVLRGAGRETTTVRAKSCRCGPLPCDCGSVQTQIRAEYARFQLRILKELTEKKLALLDRQARR